jgi:hypothetical protein
MSFGGGLFFTNNGRALQAKAQAGVQLNFTRIAVGDGQLSGQAIADLTALINEVKSLDITKLKTLTGGKAVIGGALSNQDIVTGFYWRELGLFAQDPDLGEILYCYGNAGDLAEYIPSPGGAEILEKQVDIVAIVGNASSVTATIEQTLVYATQQDIINLQQQIDNIDVTGTDVTVDQSQAPASPGSNGTIAQLFNWIANRIKAITGKTNWWESPTKSIETLNSDLTSHVGDDNNPHNVTVSQIGAETPTGAQAKVDTHANRTDNPHNVTISQIGAAPSSHVGATGSAHGVATTSVNGFMSASDKTKLNSIEAGAQVNPTATEIRDALKTVDGSGSGLDADLLDGWHRDSIRAWANITGKPSTYPPSSHSHPEYEITFATGVYNGNDAASQDIIIGFTPDVVFVTEINGTTNGTVPDSTYIGGGMAINGYTNNIIDIITNGFRVYKSGNILTNDDYSTRNPHRYFAIKFS